MCVCVCCGEECKRLWRFWRRVWSTRRPDFDGSEGKNRRTVLWGGGGRKSFVEIWRVQVGGAVFVNRERCDLGVIVIQDLRNLYGRPSDDLLLILSESASYGLN